MLPLRNVISVISKRFALDFAKQCLPLYGELYKELKTEGGRVKFPGRFGTIREKVANYVELYDDERKPGVAIFLGLMGEQGFREFTAEASSWTQLENENFLSDLGSDEGQSELLAALSLPDSEEEWSKQEKHLQSLPEDERAAAIKASSFFFAGMFSHFFNTLSLMTHGATLVSLVKNAIEGNDEAFGKAIQVDRFILSHHPYFIARKQRAEDEGDIDFLRTLAYREANPNLKGKIQYPALFMLFGILEQIGWLDKLKHAEILDLCDDIGIDRYQSRIEDANYLTKRLADYRRFQKTSGSSRH